MSYRVVRWSFKTELLRNGHFVRPPPSQDNTENADKQPCPE